MKCNYSVPLFNKEGLGEILLDKSPSAPSLCSPPFSKGEVNTYTEIPTGLQEAQRRNCNGLERS